MELNGRIVLDSILPLRVMFTVFRKDSESSRVSKNFETRSFPPVSGLPEKFFSIVSNITRQGSLSFTLDSYLSVPPRLHIPVFNYPCPSSLVGTGGFLHVRLLFVICGEGVNSQNPLRK